MGRGWWLAIADNITLDAGAGGAVIKTDDDGTAHWQYVKLAFGPDNTQTRVTTTVGLPVGDAGGSLTVDNGGTFVVQIDQDALTALQLIDDVVFAEDVAAQAADKGVQVLAVRRDADTTLVGTDNDYAPLQVDANGYLKVEIFDGGGSHTVDGTVTADLGAVDNAVLDAIAASVAGTLTVGSHAVTNAGTFVVQVDGAALTSLQLLDDVVFAEDVAAQAADKGIQVLAVRRDADTTLVGTDNDYAPLQVDANGYLKVEVFDGGDSHTIDGTVTANLSATDNAVLDAIEVDTTTIAGAVSGTEMQVDVVASLPAGTNGIGKLTANSGVDIGDVDVTSIAAGANLIGDVSLQPRTTGGLTIFKSIDLDESEEDVKVTAGQVYSIIAFNTTAAPLFLKLYNATAANVVVGTTVPDITLLVPANADSDGAGLVWPIPQGIAFGTAISAAVTTLVADNDATAPGANACIVCILYK